MNATWLRVAAVPVAVAAAGYRARALTGRGALSAIAVGASVGKSTSWPGILLLGTFFVSSSALSRALPSPQTTGKGSRRDSAQVLANGGVAAIAGLVLAGRDNGSALAAVAGSLAAATADTWATEIGGTSPSAPRQLVHRRQVEPGESGGVTRRGLLASAGGAVLIAAMAGLVFRHNAQRVFVSTAVAGMSGSLADSLAGELLQERRYCYVCGLPTEARIHGCGSDTRHVSGVRGITNDTVNLLCTLSGGVLGFLLFRR